MKRLFCSIVLLAITITLFSQPKPVSIEKKGSGAPVMLLPGFGCPGAVWNEYSSGLKNYQVHQVSYAGFNQLPAIDTPWYKSLRDALIDYIKKEDLKNLHLIGHSMGGNLATEIAASLPDRVSKLVIVDALPCMREIMTPGMSASQLTYDNPYNNQMLAMDQQAMAKYVKMMADNMTLEPARSATIQEWMMQADRKTFVYGYTELLKMDLRDELKKINIPVLILGASFPDRKTTEATFQAQYVNLPDKMISISNNSKHFIMFDDAGWMNNSISQYFAK
ncbi:alpha/beta hydrolase [Terrimonas sp. NA20]|uniref:Alpha/beta hydrolase n=1 Tax=Terrimonas ginsenosidimutans TaxID=2908004 RepID=A0ABS9KUI8_9BACT|nr:alpha/beta hydrolase [Terrimonas ginsenosidimutans]MCG2615971.1 alpha/beta hydrolase [Terrimonas ginsenosidimutans]